MDPIFADFGWRPGRVGAAWVPSVDILERTMELVIVVEMAGVDREDIRISWKDGVLTVVGNKRRQPAEEETCRYLCVERAYGHFRRDIAISVDVDFSKARSELREGLLRIRLPKSRMKAAEVVIPIE